jgi:type IV pilus biogenesis protein CpaD/CtpE
MRALRPSSVGAIAAVAACATLLAAGCAHDKVYSQAELNAIQTRDFDADFDHAYDAAIGALFDASYTVNSSDKRGGLLTAHRRSGDTWAGFSSSEVQVKLTADGPRRTSIRVSTGEHGQQRVDKARIDEILNLIDRRLTAAPPAAGRPQ